MPASSSAPDHEASEDDLQLEPDCKHSGLGIASFLIAMLVGGLDVILALVIAVNMAHTSRHADKISWQLQAVGGGMSMYCLNCMNVPLCLVGVGLALVGLIAHRNRNNLFSWIGLMVNGAIILGVVGLYVLNAMLGG